jgi:hypothetical protein
MTGEVIFQAGGAPPPGLQAAGEGWGHPRLSCCCPKAGPEGYLPRVLFLPGMPARELTETWGSWLFTWVFLRTVLFFFLPFL